MSTAREIHVGTSADDFDFQLGDRVAVHFHDFESIRVNDFIESPTFSCAGYEWSLWLKLSDHDVDVYLDNDSSEDIVASYEMKFLNSYGDPFKTFSRESQFCASNPTLIAGKVRRSLIIGDGYYDDDESSHILNKGTLTLVVQITPTKEHYRRPANPQAEYCDNIFKLFGDKKIADLAFTVSNTIFYGHKQILKVQAPDLFELAENFDKDTPMPIKDVKPEIFEFMLKYVYGKTIHRDEWIEHFEEKEHSKEILKASEKYGFVALRVEAEAWYIKCMDLTEENAVDELLYSDGNHFLKIKEAVIKFIVENGQAVISSSSFPRLVESSELMTEVMMQFAQANACKKRKLNELSRS